MKNCKKTLRRGLALFVALVMCLSVMSITAYAGEVVSEPETLTEEETPDESANQEEPAGEEEPAEEIPDPVEAVEPDEGPTPIEGEAPVEDETPAFARSLFPSTAFAAGSVDIYAQQCYLPGEGKNYPDPIDQADSERITPTQQAVIGSTSSSTINLWVYSKDMEAEGKKDGGAIPYYKGQDGQTWYLNKIMWGTSTKLNNATVVMSAEQIATATSKDSYNFSTSELKGASVRNPKYYIIYFWSTNDSGEPTPPVNPDPPTYTVNYSFNPPAGTTVVAVETDGRIDGLNEGIRNPNPKPGVKAGEILQLIPESKYTAYFAYNTGTGTDFLDSGFYTFKGWKMRTAISNSPAYGARQWR